MLLFHSDQLILDTPVVALEIKVCYVFSFLNNLKSDNRALFIPNFTQKSNTPSTVPVTYRHLLLLSVGRTSSKIKIKRLLTLSYSFPPSPHITKAVWSLNAAPPKKE